MRRSMRFQSDKNIGFRLVCWGSRTECKQASLHRSATHVVEKPGNWARSLHEVLVGHEPSEPKQNPSQFSANKGMFSQKRTKPLGLDMQVPTARTGHAEC